MSRREEPAAQVPSARCWLVPWSTVASASTSEAKAADFKPSLAIDVGETEIGLTDLDKDTLVASAPLSETTATPAARIGGFSERRYVPKGLPILVVSIPGAERLTIGCIEPPQRWLRTYGYLFSWRGTVLRESYPAYLVSGNGWMTLVEKFGLAAQLEGRLPKSVSTGTTSTGQPPPLYTQPRSAKIVRWILFGWLAVVLTYFVVLAVLALVHH
jgi:hypothetical protein